MAFQSILANKLRSLLSILGITIGIFSIVLVYTLVDSLEKNIKSSIESMGKNVIYIDKWEWMAGGNDYPWWKFVNRPSAKLSEIEALELHPVSNLIEAISFSQNSNSDIKVGKNSVESVEVKGYSYTFPIIQNLEFNQGRFYNEFEDKSGSPVIVLGDNVAKGLFPESNSYVGKNVTLFGKQLNVIGTLKNQGDNLINIDFDDAVIVPIKFLKMVTSNESEINTNLIVKAKDNITSDDLYGELKGAMRGIRRIKPTEEDNFSLNKISFLSESISEFFGTINTMGLIIGLFSLLVGGFGVANIMFVSVKERTNLIGIQKSLGAKNQFILIQFLTEAVTLCIFGGLIGIGLTYGMAYLGNFVLENSMKSTFRLFVSVDNFLYGVFFASIIGLLSGIIPAYKASRLVPVEAIRSK